MLYTREYKNDKWLYTSLHIQNDFSNVKLIIYTWKFLIKILSIIDWILTLISVQWIALINSNQNWKKYGRSVDLIEYKACWSFILSRYITIYISYKFIYINTYACIVCSFPVEVSILYKYICIFSRLLIIRQVLWIFNFI